MVFSSQSQSKTKITCNAIEEHITSSGDSTTTSDTSFPLIHAPTSFVKLMKKVTNGSFQSPTNAQKQRRDCSSVVDSSTKGTKVGNYYIDTNTLGQGAYGQVFVGRKRIQRRLFLLRSEVHDDVDVAIKVQPHNKLNTRAKRQRAKLEIRILKQNGHHPNIVTFYEHMHVRKNLFIVMERATMDLYELKSKTNSFRIQSDLKQQIMKGILKATDYLHKRGIAHLDLKPTNILIRASALDENNGLRSGTRLVHVFVLVHVSKTATFAYVISVVLKLAESTIRGAHAHSKRASKALPRNTIFGG